MKGSDNKGKIEYHYPTNQKITYNGGGSGKPPVVPQPNADPSQAEKLVNAYDNDKMVKYDKPVPVLNKDGSPTMKNGEPVTKKSYSTGSKEYQEQKKAAEQNLGQVEWPTPEQKQQHLDTPVFNG